MPVEARFDQGIHFEESFDLLGVRVRSVSFEDNIQKIKDWIEQRHRTYICCAPVFSLVEASRNEDYRQILNEAGMTTPDGMPVVWAGRLKGFRRIERTYGPDLMERLCAEEGLKHFFYGGTEAVIEKLIVRFKRRFPNLEAVGAYAPPYREAGEDEHPEVIDRINASGADIVWVGLGAPKQDMWMARHRSRLTAPVLIGVGAAFDFLSGTKPQAPAWMRNSGLEWLFRWGCEPRRLGRRYLVGNTVFLIELFKSFFPGKRRPSIHAGGSSQRR